MYSKQLNQLPNFQSFIQYLENPWFIQDYFLSKKRNLSFCWLDASFTTELVRNYIFKTPELMDKFNNRHKILKSSIIWVKSNNKIFEHTLFNLYKYFIVNGHSPKNNEIEISFMSPLGPFKKLHLNDFINPDTYHEIIIELLLNKELKERNFRFRVDGQVKVYFDQIKAFFYLDVRQISQDGILFSSDDSHFLNEFNKNEKLNFLFDTSLFETTKKFSTNDLSAAFESYPYKIFLTHDIGLKHTIPTKEIRKTYQFDQSKKFKHYLYMPFNNIESDALRTRAIMNDFAKNLKDNLQKEIKYNQPLFLVK